MKMLVIPDALWATWARLLAGSLTMPPFIVDGHFTSGSGKRQLMHKHYEPTIKKKGTVVSIDV